MIEITIKTKSNDSNEYDITIYESRQIKYFNVNALTKYIRRLQLKSISLADKIESEVDAMEVLSN
jgi:hypothetical protein